MHSRGRVLAIAVGVLVALAGVAVAQQQRPGQQQQQRQTGQGITLVYEREVFAYPGSARRDPFIPLTDENEMGPRFENLTLRGIIYSTGRGASVALLADGDGRVYRARVGDVVGNTTVVEIGPLRVVMAVESFGAIRQEMLELQRNQGANR